MDGEIECGVYVYGRTVDLQDSIVPERCERFLFLKC
jgi:hypothetical protein